jgi:hypothetical protein
MNISNEREEIKMVTWTTVKELEKMSQETRNNLAVNFGKRTIPLNDIDLDVFSRSSAFPIVRMSIFDKVEKEYLSALLNVINVTRDQGTTAYISKIARYNRKTRKDDLFEIWVSFRYNHKMCDITLPPFSADKNYYRGMVVDEPYNLEQQLSLPARDIYN